jgi:hypothetical protein
MNDWMKNKSMVSPFLSWDMAGQWQGLERCPLSAASHDEGYLI